MEADLLSALENAANGSELSETGEESAKELTDLEKRLHEQLKIAAGENSEKTEQSAEEDADSQKINDEAEAAEAGISNSTLKALEDILNL